MTTLNRSTASGPGADIDAPETGWRKLRGQSWLGAFAAVIALWLLAGALTGTLSLGFILANATIAGFLALAGAAQMTVIASGPGNFDLSLPYTITFGAYVMSSGLLGDANTMASVCLTLAAGALIGAFNAGLIVLLRIPAIVATLASGYIIYSLIVAVQSAGFSRVGGMFEAALRYRMAGIPGALVVTLITLALLAVVLSRMVFGVQLHAMGQNAEAARLAGVRRGRVMLLTFVISGVLAAWLGAMLATYQGGVSTDLGRSYLLGSVAAVVVGGTRITGGVTSVFGTILGALVLTLAQSDLILMHVSIGAQYAVQGLIVLGTVSAVAYRHRDSR